MFNGINFKQESMKDSLAQHILQQVKANYNHSAKEFSATRFNNWKEITNLSNKYIKDGMMILDVGCGNGRITQELKNKNIKYIGIDNSTELLKEAIHNFNDRSNFSFLEGDILELPFAENQFDVIVCVAVMHHVPSKNLRDKAMLEIHRVLKPGGILIMSNWNLYQKKYRKYLYRFTIAKIKTSIHDFFSPHKEDCGSAEEITLKINRMEFGDIFLPSFGRHFGEENNRGRYHHAFTKAGIKTAARRAGFWVKECYYSQRGEKTGWQKGRNLILIGEKILVKPKIKIGIPEFNPDINVN